MNLKRSCPLLHGDFPASIRIDIVCDSRKAVLINSSRRSALRYVFISHKLDEGFVNNIEVSQLTLVESGIALGQKGAE